MPEWRCNADAERSLIGSAMLGAVLQPRTVDAAIFGLPPHQAIWQAVCHASQSGPVDALTVKAALGDELEVCGGQPYLVQCLQSPPNARNWRGYLAIVEREATARKLQAAIFAAQKALEGGSAPELVSEGLESARRASAGRTQAFSEIAALDLPERETGVQSPFPGMNALSGGGAGFVTGQLSVVSAYHKGGKTIFGTQAAACAAEIGGQQNYHVVYATFADLTPERLMVRMFRQRTGLNWPRTVEEFGYLRELQALPIHFYDGRRSGRDVQDFANALRQLIERVPVGFAVCDYAQVMRCKGAATSYERLEGVAYELALLADDLGIPVICLSQISGQVKGGSSSDIITKGGRGLEENAGLVIRIMKEEEKEGDVTNVRRCLDIPYNRFGPDGNIPVYLDEPYLSFRESQA